jgi:hypothetical protein
MTNTPLIDQLAEEIRTATDFKTNKQILREKILTDLHLTFGGGMFNITPALIAFVATWPSDTLYLEDVYNNPVEIDRASFLLKAQQHYQSVMNEWHNQYDAIKRIRKV